MENVRKMKIRYLGREFEVISNNQLPGTDEAIEEKRRVNQIISKVLQPQDIVIDAFAGYGLSTFIWASRCKVIAIERDKEVFSCLAKNFKNYTNVTCLKGNNISILKTITKSPDIRLIDLDPYANCYKQIPLALDLLDNGILLVTSGEVMSLYRRLNLKRYGNIEKYKGYANFYRFPQEVLFEKYIKGECEKRSKRCELVYYYVYPTSARMVITVGDFKFSPEILAELGPSPKFLGWVRKKVNQNNIFKYI